VVMYETYAVVNLIKSTSCTYLSTEITKF